MLEAALGEPSGVDTLLLFSKSFLPSLLFSFSRIFSESLSFSLAAGSCGADTLFSLPPFPAPRAVSCVLEGKSGKSGEEEDDVVDDKLAGFPADPLLPSEAPCEARVWDPVEKVLKPAGVKALAAIGLAMAPVRTLVLLLETELVNTDSSAEPLGPGT